MYGDTDVMRKRAAQLREQGVDIRAMADHLVAQTEGIGWSGRAAESMRERVRDRAAHLREVAAGHETAAESLEKHLLEVDLLKESIASTERRAGSIVADARTRVARVDAHDDPDGVRREADPGDRALAAFTPPPSGHRDWLAVEIPGL
ncbi:hypothetical protein H5V45_10220 [Nocardioides sp. KIGAM211]|uniref:Uncharacterized protein n=1 Tax=Nocardioides luti TaxID=2761101 RepID=A0A7X0RHZ4_9ACTN|nr:hypothetical protein [Nocardioides luti]MBB6627695.1 hypothetical protein [Nocardioides luti]